MEQVQVCGLGLDLEHTIHTPHKIWVNFYKGHFFIDNYSNIIVKPDLSTKNFFAGIDWIQMTKKLNVWEYL